MDRLPDELILNILSFLEPKHLIKTQSVSRRLFLLARDNSLWKAKCFNGSFNEIRRRHRRRLNKSTSCTAFLFRAYASALASQTSLALGSDKDRRRSKPNGRARAIANWDPSYRNESINFYEEYIHRHARIRNNWFEPASDDLGDKQRHMEATGVALLYDEDETRADKLYGALEDGSLSVWDVSTGQQSTTRGRPLDRTAPGLLCGNHTLSADAKMHRPVMTQTGTVERFSIDCRTKRGYLAVANRLNEIDLATLQVISCTQYRDPITAISEAKYPTPLTIGSTTTLQLYDPRDHHSSQATRAKDIRLDFNKGSSSTPRFEDPAAFHASSQPGPLSIVHLTEDHAADAYGSIWVAGRFSSLINYDRRFLHRVRATVHSGSKLSCLRSSPHQYLPRGMDLLETDYSRIPATHGAESVPGRLLIAAGDYKGKGSLELYGLPSRPVPTTLPSGDSEMRVRPIPCRNRQTASASRLFSLAHHGGKLVYSDGDGNIKWTERDGFTPIRLWNINDELMTTASDTLVPDSFAIPRPPRFSDMQEDIVQLLLPTMPKSTFGHDSIGEDNLVIWTTEGRVGLVGFGKRKWDLPRLEEEALGFEERKRRQQEREYDGMMGRALRRQQDELRFLQSFGLGRTSR